MGALSEVCSRRRAESGRDFSHPLYIETSEERTIRELSTSSRLDKDAVVAAVGGADG